METLIAINRADIIDRIIHRDFKGMKMDNIYYNDRFAALDKLTDEQLIDELEKPE